MPDNIDNILKQMPSSPLPINERIFYLKKLKNILKQNREKIYEAMLKDLQKSFYETELSELNPVFQELNLYLKNIKKWAKRHKVKASLGTFPSKSFVEYQAYGKVLIFVPWNYPINLSLIPLIDAIGAGNRCIIKLSPQSKKIKQILNELIGQVFPQDIVHVFTADDQESEQLLKHYFDLIFFTGSTKIGKKIYAKAAEKLIPCILELGGKSPVIFDNSLFEEWEKEIKITSAKQNVEFNLRNLYNDYSSLQLLSKINLVNTKLNKACRRIIWAKLLNCGQTCVAPDYIWVPQKYRDLLIYLLRKEYRSYLENVGSENIAALINKERYLKFKDEQNKLVQQYNQNKKWPDLKIINDEDNLKLDLLISPASFDDNIMQEEIFGPILPIIAYENEIDIYDKLQSYAKPLAVYIFSSSKSWSDNILSELSFGTAAVNDCVIQIANHNYAFGGTGESGLGSYHGYKGFQSFSREKRILFKKYGFDLPFRFRNNKIYLNILKFISNFI